MTTTQDLAQFIQNWNTVILSRPISGKLFDVFSLFSSKYENAPEWATFQMQVSELVNITHGIHLNQESVKEDTAVTYIDTLALALFCDIGQEEPDDATNAESAKESMEPTLESFLSIINCKMEPSSLFAATSNKFMLEDINRMLKQPMASRSLSLEKTRMNTPVEPFIEICHDKSHAETIQSVANGMTDPYKIHLAIKTVEPNSPVIACMNTHIHFVPIITRWTDPSLGDCSYLDTCHKLDSYHKLDSCKYLHYRQLMPLTQDHPKRDPPLKSFYTKGDPVVFKPQLPAQWINCDVRNFDFSVLGKFAAIVADPPWAINTKTPNKASDDPNLTCLPVEMLQDEGVIFLWVTGRTTETGRQALRHWGYEVADEISWLKTNQLIRTICTGRTGHWLNHSKEHLQVGVKGRPKWLTGGSDTQVLVAPTRQTGRKPDELYGLIERLVGKSSRKLEMFGRNYNTRPGWFTLGNELNGSHIVEQDVQMKYKRFMEQF